MTMPSPPRPAWRARAGASLAALRQRPWRDIAATLRDRFREDNLALTAGSLTFTTTIALVPLVTVALAAFSAFPIFQDVQRALERYFLQTLVPDTIARPVLTALTQFAHQASRLGIAGLVILVLTALALMQTIDRTLNAIWRVRQPRPLAQRLLVYWAAATLGPLLLGLSLSLTSYAISSSSGLVQTLPAPVSVLLNSLEYFLLAGAMAALFHFVPNVHVRWRHALAGGLFVATGIEFAKKALGYYVASVPTYSAVYGAFATVPIFLVWIYLAWVIVLLGAVIAAYAPSLELGVRQRPATPGYRFQLAVGVLRELDAVRHAAGHGLDLDALSRRLRTDPLQIEPVLESLVAMDWVGRLDEGDEARHVLLCDPESTPAGPLFAALLLQPGPSLAALWDRLRLAEMRLSDLLAG